MGLQHIPKGGPRIGIAEEVLYLTGIDQPSP
jgi:hypothetical protein